MSNLIPGDIILPDEVSNVSSTVSIDVAVIIAVTLAKLRTSEVSARQRFYEMVVVMQRPQSIGGNVTRINQIGVHVADLV